MSVPTTPFSLLTPAGSDQINAGDNQIRLLKTQINEVIDVDHNFPSSGSSATTGFHNQVTLIEAADIGSGAEGLPILGAQTISGKPELVYTTEDDADIQITTGDKIRTLSLKSASASDMANLMELIYPVGIVVTLGVSTNPATLFGVGTWTAIAGRVIVGIDAGQTEFDTLDETGGAKTHTLTGNEMPSHSHTISAKYGATYNSGNVSSNSLGALSESLSTGAVGGGSAHNNLQPYIVKYVYQRVS